MKIKATVFLFLTSLLLGVTAPFAAFAAKEKPAAALLGAAVFMPVAVRRVRRRKTF